MKTMSKEWRVKREKGAVAVMVAISMVLLMAAAALGVDIAKLVYTKQTLRNALDAGAQAGSQALPDTEAAKSVAKSFFKANFTEWTKDPTIMFFCVVGTEEGSPTPDLKQVNYACPGSAASVASAACNSTICAIPCAEGVTNSCNTIRLTDAEEVPFYFGPAIGIPIGHTGALSSAACRGSCGTVTSNPLDVVVMADRTPSMDFSEIDSMKEGMRNMLKTMDRNQQFVAFGTLAYSRTDSSGCQTGAPSGGEAFVHADYANGTGVWGGSYVPYDGTNKEYTFDGNWVPIPFSNDFTTGEGAELELNASSSLVAGIDCMPRSDPEVRVPYADDGFEWFTNTGTHLASALKGASRYLLGLTPNNLSSMPDRSEYGTPKKVIIFETDGAPSEVFNSAESAMTLMNDLDIGAIRSESEGCANFKRIADLAKAEGITILTIGYGNVNTAECAPGVYVRDVLASVASPTDLGEASTARDCTDPAERAAENSDGDNYYCGASAEDLAAVFATAMGSVTGHSKLIAIEGFTN